LAKQRNLAETRKGEPKALINMQNMCKNCMILTFFLLMTAVVYNYEKTIKWTSL